MYCCLLLENISWDSYEEVEPMVYMYNSHKETLGMNETSDLLFQGGFYSLHVVPLTLYFLAHLFAFLVKG